jgi:ABC-type phosphate/phosphonate transport system permease subunit
MQPVLKRKLKLLFTICVITTISAVIYQYIDIEFVDVRSIYTGISLGVSFGILELFIITRYQHLFYRLPFIWHLFLKTILYTIIISLVAASLSLLLELSEGRFLDRTFYARLLFSFNLYPHDLYLIGILYSDKQDVGRRCIVKIFMGKLL